MSTNWKVLVWTVAPFLLVLAIHLFIREGLGQRIPQDNGALSAGLGIAKLLKPTNEMDSWEPMLRARSVADSAQGSRLYETVFFEERIKFQYPPTSLLALDALDQFGLLNVGALNTINRVFFLANALMIGALASMFIGRGPAADSRAPGGGGRNVSSSLLILCAFASAMIFWPLGKAMDLGQIQIWIDLAFTGASLAWLLDRKLIAGALIGLACAIKPQFGLLLLWAILWQRWDFAKGFLVVTVPVLGLSLLRYGWHNHWAYLDVLSYIGRHGETLFPNNSVNGIVNRLLFNGDNLIWHDHAFAPYNPIVYAATLAAFAAFTLLALAPALRRRRPEPAVFDFGAAALCSVMGSPIAWEHHYGIMMPLFVITVGTLLTRQRQEAQQTSLILLAVSWALSANFMGFMNLLSGSIFNVLQSYLFFGGILLLLVLMREAHEAGPREPKVQALRA